MLKTNSSIRVFCAIALVSGLAVASGALHAQTIENLAEIQSAKLNDDLRRARGLPDPAQAKAAEASVSFKRAAIVVPPPSSGLTVHSIYSRGSSAKIAELSDGLNVFIAVPGTRYGPFVVEGVSQAGVKIMPVSCKKTCTAQLVPVGGAF